MRVDYNNTPPKNITKRIQRTLFALVNIDISVINHRYAPLTYNKPTDLALRYDTADTLDCWPFLRAHSLHIVHSAKLRVVARLPLHPFSYHLISPLTDPFKLRSISTLLKPIHISDWYRDSIRRSPWTNRSKWFVNPRDRCGWNTI